MDVIIDIPEDIGGGDLKVLPEDTYAASLTDLILGTSSTGNPKLTAVWVITSEFEGDWPFDGDRFLTMGEKVLETYSLLPQAIFGLNDLYKAKTGEQLEHRQVPAEQFAEEMRQALIGMEALLDVVIGTRTGGERSEVNKKSFG